MEICIGSNWRILPALDEAPAVRVAIDEPGRPVMVGRVLSGPDAHGHVHFRADDGLEVHVPMRSLRVLQPGEGPLP